MRKLPGLIAVILGVVGVLLCAAVIGIGWWTAVKTVDRVDRVATRVDHGLSEADDRLALVELRVNAVRSDIDEVRKQAEALAAENPELPRVKAAIERLLDRFVPALDRLEAMATSLRSVAAGLRAVADIVDQIRDDSEAMARLRNIANTIDRAAETLNLPRAKIDAAKSAKAVWLTRELIQLVREAVAGSELLAKGLAIGREEIAFVRKRATELRDEVVFRVYVASTANSIFWLWGGLGQLCLAGWGRRRITTRTATIT